MPTRANPSRHLRALLPCLFVGLPLLACKVTVVDGDDDDASAPEASADASAMQDASTQQDATASASAIDGAPDEPDEDGGDEGLAMGDEDGGTAGEQDSGPPPPVLAEVTTIGVGVGGDSFCADGSFSVTIQPTDSEGDLFIPAAAEVTCTASIDTQAVSCEVRDVACTTGSESSDAATALLVIIDDSASMNNNDPDEKRADACAAFVDHVGSGAFIAITDFGRQSTAPADELGVLQDFTDDLAVARAACMAIETGGQGTPIYGSVIDAVEVFLPSARQAHGQDLNYAVLLLSDGEPGDSGTREEALAAARQAQVPVFTVGLGPAAEGASNADSDAITVLQELSEETGGSYASSADADGLESLFMQVASAVRRGRCQVSARIDTESFTVGQSIEGTIVLQSGQASTSYAFTVPASELADSRCSP